MKRAALFCLFGICFLFGCEYSKSREFPKRKMPIGYASKMAIGRVPGPFFNYGQTTLSESFHIDLGDIPLDVRKITATVPFANSGKEMLFIENVFGQCSCFVGWAFDKQWDSDQGVAPGHYGVINVFFDKNKIESGKITRFVRIKTNDPANGEVKIFFDFNVIRTPEEEDIYSLQNEVQSIKNELQTLRKEIRGRTSVKNANCNKAVDVNTNKLDTTVYDITIGASPMLGPSTAPVTIVEFFDFQCPYCAKEYTKLKQILSEYPGKVRLILKHFPLNFHKRAPAAHAVTKLVLRQQGSDAFWKIHDMIMSDPQKLEIAVLKTYAQSVGLDTTELNKLLADENSVSELLKVDKESAKKCKVRSTPTVFINGKRLADRSLEGYHNQIKQILSVENKTIERAK